MKLSFNLEDISYVKLEYVQNGVEKTAKMALKEKKENEFIAVTEKMDILGIEFPQAVELELIAHDGLYKTRTILNDVMQEDDGTVFVIGNPKALDYQQNREYYRVIAEYDCIYTVDTGYEVESFNAVTYDISAGGVSIIVDSNAISQEGMSLVICMPDRDIKSHLRFIRCEMVEDNYKLSFEFTDISERDYDYLTKMCVSKQMSSF